MSELFLKFFNMSISASWLVLAVLLLRLVLKKAPKWVSVLLWGFVAVRLICPFSFESVLSLIPSAETISPDIMLDPTPEIHTGIGSVNSVINPVVSEAFAPDRLASMNPLQLWIPLAAVIWIVGIAAMLIYTAVSYWLLRRKVATAVLLRNNIYQSENVDSPFVLGIVKPRIYLPFRMDGKNLEYVIAHEASHIRRKDHWWKPFGFLLLAIHWFNPLMWIGYILLCRDIELACDEKVIKEMDNENRADYTQALVACSVNRRRIAACPLAFGEVGVKERVKSVMNYKKPAFWIIVAALITCIVVAVCFLTNPKDSAPKDPSNGARANIHSHAYVVEEVTYESGIYSFFVVAGENSPIYAITEDMMLTSQKEYSEEGTWAQLGKLEVTELTKENFDNLFKDPGKWADNVSAKNIRNNTEKAWQLIYNQDVLYYVLHQKNGDLFLAYGYTGFSNNDANYAHIRWLYKLAIDTTGMFGGAEDSTTTYSEVKLTDRVSDAQESSYKVSAFLPATDLSSPGQVLADKIKSEWDTFDGMTQQQQWASSHLWGTIYIETDTWSKCEQAIGVAIDNPLVSIDWINKTGYFGMESVDPGTPVTHVQATAYATPATDRELSEISVTAGYTKGDVRITLTATVSAKAGNLTTGCVSRGYATYEENTLNTGSGAPVLVVTTNEANNTGYYNGDYFDPVAYWVKNNVFYTLRVFGDAVHQAEIQNTLEQLIAEI